MFYLPYKIRDPPDTTIFMVKLQGQWHILDTYHISPLYYSTEIKYFSLNDLF